jgi:hypothetical protein
MENGEWKMVPRFTRDDREWDTSQRCTIAIALAHVGGDETKRGKIKMENRKRNSSIENPIYHSPFSILQPLLLDI